MMYEERLIRESKEISDIDNPRSQKNISLINNLYIKYSSRLDRETKIDPKKLFFKLEKIYWEYIKNHSTNDAFIDFQFKKFCKILIPNSDLKEFIPDFETAFRDYNSYRKCIPVCGFIMLSKDMDKILLVKSRYSDYWGFPKGKINENEDYLKCAIRETQEETGFKINPNKNYLKFELKDNGKTQVLFLASGIDERFKFKPIDYEEISDVKFFKFNDLPELTGNVIPFIPSIEQFIKYKNSIKL